MEFFCGVCDQEARHADMLCEFCQHEIICNKCQPNHDTYVASWLNVTNICEICHKRLCRTCVRVCMTCSCGGTDIPSNGNLSQVSCPTCLLLVRICDIHDWYICQSHPEPTRCEQCQANQNYTLRHGP